jgi:1-acyl-sn-glycerol-3-phosphate acyltransferase
MHFYIKTNLRRIYFRRIGDMDEEKSELGLTHEPREGLYKRLAATGLSLLSRGILNKLIGKRYVGNFEVFGQENLRHDHFQLFLCNHLFYTDGVLVPLAIIMASGDDTPIPAPAYKEYVLHQHLGKIMQPMYAYPIYGREDGYDKRSESIRYSVDVFYRQKRLLIFPEGEIARNGIYFKKKPGALEIALRTYQRIMEQGGFETTGKKGIVLTPANISYYPLPGLPFKYRARYGDREVLFPRTKIENVSIRFGRPVDFEEAFIRKFDARKSRLSGKAYYGLKNLYRIGVHNRIFRRQKKRIHCDSGESRFEVELRMNLGRKLLQRISKEIGSLTTVNLDHIMSQVIYDLAKYHSADCRIRENDLLEIIFAVVDILGQSGKFHLADHLEGRGRGKMRIWRRFRDRCIEEGFLRTGGTEENYLDIDYDRVMFEPETNDYFKYRNLVMYNKNLISHLSRIKAVTRGVERAYLR